MNQATGRHDAYAAEYDQQIQAYGCYLPEALFGLAYEFVEPGQTVLDLGIGTGLAARLFARAGLRVYGMDFSSAMLDLCRVKGVAVDLKQHDVQTTPWPYAAGAFSHVVCCGVLHFVLNLETVFAETGRVLEAGGLCAFTTKTPNSSDLGSQSYERVVVDGLEVFSHAPAYVETVIAQSGFEKLRALRCFVGQDMFDLWLVWNMRRFEHVASWHAPPI